MVELTSCWKWDGEKVLESHEPVGRCFLPHRMKLLLVNCGIEMFLVCFLNGCKTHSIVCTHIGLNYTKPAENFLPWLLCWGGDKDKPLMLSDFLCWIFSHNVLHWITINLIYLFCRNRLSYPENVLTSTSPCNQTLSLSSEICLFMKSH